MLSLSCAEKRRIEALNVVIELGYSVLLDDCYNESDLKLLIRSLRLLLVEAEGK